MTSSPLPGAPFLAYREGELFLEDVRLADLANEHGTPLFVYSKASMLAALNAYRRGLQGRQAHVHYAMKATARWRCCRCLPRPAAALTLCRAASLSGSLPLGATHPT